MRLPDNHRRQIIALAKQYLGEDIKLYLFGSRVDDYKKGGDIDLFAEAEREIDMESEIKFLTAIAKNVTERKVDLIIKTPAKAYKNIFDTAKNTGIRLC